MVKELAGDRKVNVFFEHFRGVNRRKAPGEGSSVPIEEEEVLAKQGGVAVGFEGLGEQEVQGVIYDEPNGNVEEQNEEPLFNDGEMDDDQMQALRELGRLNRKRKSQRTKTRPNYELYDGVSDFKEVKLEVGQVFVSSKVFKEVTKEYAIRCGRVIWFPCNENGRVKGICKGKNTNCPWTIWASKYEKNSDAFMIKTLNDKHTCPRSNKNRHANSAWLSRRAKLKACEIIEGSLSQYAKLWDYAEELKKTNPGSTVVIDTELGPDDKNKFKRIYICFNACKQGWLHGCRKIIGLDACHVKAYHKAQLMWAEDLNLTDCLGITFMTDRQKGLVESIGDIWPNCEHRFCVRHMYANFKKKFKDNKIRGKMWKAARSTTVDDFQICMAEIKKLNEKAWEWLNEISPSQWSKSYFSVYPKCDMTLNNLCEIVNGNREVLEARSSPIYSMLEMLRIKIMNRRARRIAEIKRWPPLVPPKIVKQPGRPKKLRIREIGEIPPSQRKFKQVHKSYTCSACKQEVHNYKSCSKRAELITRISKKKTTQSIKSPSPQTESSNAPETDHGEDDVEPDTDHGEDDDEPDTDHGEDDVEVANQDFFSEMIRQTAIEKNIDFSCTLDTETWKENMMSTLHSAMENFKQMVQNLQNETSVTKKKKKKTQ
ncbi:hypothetical protein Dsin_012378 [Dipteronia sinensis]|uniref:Transposase MuDR plant domain-containing protein n=1 Tax=Dipteronia sinensis TaxID=43782 RepID=A0AAE0E7W6_9ROSI|nr:hypothetical protein Dsin_012378 [Dipteronia sinensis]